MNKGDTVSVPDYLAIGFEKLTRDLRYLMECFSEVLLELDRPQLAEHLPWLGRVESEEEPPAQLGLAYSVAFQILNMVEEHAAAEMRNLRERSEGLTAEQGCWGNAIARVRQAVPAAADSPGEFLAGVMQRVRVEPVLTAHPTEAKRLSVLEQHRQLFALLEEASREDLSPSERYSTRSAVKAALERLWRTGEILLQKPALDDERRNVLHYLRNVFPAVLPALDERLRVAWKDAGLDSKILNEPGVNPRIRFGTWVGGDRDGHPGVTAEVTAETLRQLRVNALMVVRRALEGLAEKLALSSWMQPAPARLVEALAEHEAALGPQARVTASEEEPWRRCVQLMLRRLPLSSDSGEPTLAAERPGAFRFSADLLGSLDALADALKEVGASRLAHVDVRPVRRTVEVFGFHLAQLDIRQGSVFHAKALTQLMEAAGVTGDAWDDWSEAERLRFLARELRSPRPFLHSSASCGPEADAVLSCYRVLAEHIRRHGANGIGSLIVSMTRRISDLLVVYLLAREAGLVVPTPEGLACELPVVPLFETIEDLEGAPEMLVAFLEEPMTRRSLELHALRANRPGQLLQQVMVGYSDSNKDGGILASQWALHTSQSKLAEAGRLCGVDIRFFHGRGGTVSRGAGPTHRFLEALPHGSLSGHLRATEQGETIAQKYANPATATYNLELLLAGVTATTALHTEAPPHDPGLGSVMTELSTASRMAYRALLEQEGFMEFYRQATPIDALEHSRIGSRPSRRTGQASLADLRAIPWVFSWNQARFYVPGWYGVGSGLHALSAERFAELTERGRRWPFLHYVMTNVESSLASTDRDLMAEYADLVEDKALRDRFMQRIEAEWDLTHTMLERVRGKSLIERRPRMLKTLQLRADALKVLHRQQIALLRQWRERNASGDSQSAEEMLPELLLSINAIASGLRTTG